METKYQPNINEAWKIANKNIDLNIYLKPISNYEHYYDYSFLEHGNKILLPKSILFELSNYENIPFPLNIKINETIFGVYEFKEDIDVIYLPTQYFIDLQLTELYPINISVLINQPCKANSITIKPYSNIITQIPDLVNYLTQSLKKYYSCLAENNVIQLPLDDSFFKFEIVKCEPQPLVSIIDVDIDVIIETSYEYDEYIEQRERNRKARLLEEKHKKESAAAADNGSKPIISGRKDTNHNDTNHNDTNHNDNSNNNNNEFIPFSGKGHKLID